MGHRKHKHRKHKCNKGGNQHQCGKNCQCEKDDVEFAEITTQEELYALLNLIMKNGKEREERQALDDMALADDMKADAESDDDPTELPLISTPEIKTQ